MTEDAIVVGAGPNGLAGAVALAQQGLSVTVLEAADTIGGGVRTSELTLPGLLHDHCAAVHPMATASPFLRSLALERHGLEWRRAEIDLAHPLDRGPAAVLQRSLDDTARGLGRDGAAWRRLFAPLSHHFDALAAELMGPPLHLPRHPVAFARFGVLAPRTATAVANRWDAPGTRALFAGVAAHAVRPLSAPGSAAIALMLIAAGHRFGWPVAHGGSQAVAHALAARLHELGGTVQTGVRVRTLSELPPSRVTLLDTTPLAALSLCGDRLPVRTQRAYARWAHGPAAFKVDLAVEGGVPWRDEACRRAGTVHLGGTLEEVAHAEWAVAHGRMPERPFVLVSQQYLADPVRSFGNVHPVWAYAHVPHGYTGDATEAVWGQLERFAPGVREHVLAHATMSPAQLESYNANYVGGDILNGANTIRQMTLRPRVALDPYSTGIPGVFLCSAATPPGPGVHGMCGYHAARSALRHLGLPKLPAEHP
ncbi:phytoene desaturase family protein [Streptomyces sp. NBC_01465]|uniref:phytoene desaturase family protein n=1 Tax=Streptomyces sp. NBC_01465 TaxID=2903878 RepID=UPI002E2F51AE|nr:NAD(P)/FAD-dependent oxidoreductase [Streptomyces sp. NBC_01465]